MLPRYTGPTPRQVFGAMVRYYREKAGMSRPELARLICKPVSLVQAIELGDRVASPEVTADLECALATDGALLHLREAIGYQPFPAWFQQWAVPGKAYRSTSRTIAYRGLRRP